MNKNILRISIIIIILIKFFGFSKQKNVVIQHIYSPTNDGQMIDEKTIELMESDDNPFQKSIYSTDDKMKNFKHQIKGDSIIFPSLPKDNLNNIQKKLHYYPIIIIIIIIITICSFLRTFKSIPFLSSSM